MTTARAPHGGRLTHRLLLSTMLAIALTACSTQRNIPTVPAIVVPISDIASPTWRSSLFPTNCRREEITQLIVRFVDAFNRGDQTQLAQFFPEEAAPYSNANQNQFQWYSVGSKEDPHYVNARNRTELLAYFARRHERREQMRLEQWEVKPGVDGGVDITFILTQQADDLPTRTVTGKGAINCDSQKIFVWSIGSAQ